jgi:20S proteasome alpha/beta subunit
MTLIIGTLCSDGIVMGADGAATLGEMGQTTIRQPIKKLDIIESAIVTGISGHVGLGQIIKGEIESLWKNQDLKGKKPYEAMIILRDKIRRHLLNELSVAENVRGALGASAILSAIAYTLIAIPIKKEFCLFQFNQQGSVEQATKDLPFVAIGSGQKIADPFLAFLRRIFWEESLPNVRQGILATLWTLEHAILTAPGGISDPTQIVILKKDGSEFIASEISKDDFNEARDAIASAEETLRKFPKNKEAPPIEIPKP